MKLALLAIYCASVTGKTLDTVTRNDVPKRTLAYWDANPDETEITCALLDYIDDRDMQREFEKSHLANNQLQKQPKDGKIGLVINGEKHLLKDHDALMICVDLFRALFNKATNADSGIPAGEIIDDFSDLAGVDFEQFLDNPIGQPELEKCPGCGDPECTARQSYEGFKKILPAEHPILELGRSIFEKHLQPVAKAQFPTVRPQDLRPNPRNPTSVPVPAPTPAPVVKAAIKKAKKVAKKQPKKK